MHPLISIVMGSRSDWPTMKNAADIFKQFEVSYKAEVISAHRTPDIMFKHASDAYKKGFEVIIAGAGGAAHLPGMIAAKTTLPVIGVPIKTSSLQGMDSLLSIVQMPKGVPVATMAIGEAGAINAALFSIRLLAQKHSHLTHRLHEYSNTQQQLAITSNPLT